ncbi:MAG TPA: hypothetical protein VK481_07750 [Gemmatimonadaceae bacterium]|nr:hypothetical protein [Gemmatimonadaceae bacterium]
MPFYQANFHFDRPVVQRASSYFDSTQMLRRLLGFSIISLVAIACSRDDTASAKTRNGPRSPDDGVAPRPSVIAPAAQPYKVAPVTDGGTITGIVEFEGSVPVEEVVRPSVDQKVCGTSIVQKTYSLSGTRVGNAIVWLTDIRSGKAFPLGRRFDLTNDKCILDPYVQVIPTNSTLNVGNDDRALQTNRFINVGTGQIIGVAPFNDDGEVVPVDRFNVPAEVEVVSEQHPWTHAWIAVLDHPYFAQTPASGAFSIEGVPAGKYRIRAWHPGLGVTDDSVTVGAGQRVAVQLRIRRAAPSTPLVSPAESMRPSATPGVPILPTAPSTSDTPVVAPTGPPPPSQ